VTIYRAIGLGGAMLEELAGMILANSKPAALYVRLADGSTGRFTWAGWRAGMTL
jgi:predicted GNAT family acetyltransferase